MLLFVNLLMAIVGGFAGSAVYIAVVGFGNRQTEGIIASSIAGVLVNRGLAELHQWLAKKPVPTQE